MHILAMRDSWERGALVRRNIVTFLLPVIVLALALTGPTAAAPRTKQQFDLVPLELKLFGPHFIREGQNLKFTAQLINRSSAPVLVPSSDAVMYFTMWWTISDISGRPLKQMPMFYCPVGGFGWYGPETLRMRDSDLVELRPGEKQEFTYDDISESYIFPGRGQYVVNFFYSSTLPVAERESHGSIGTVSVTYDLSGLSAEKFASLKRTPLRSAASGPFVIELY